MFIKTPSGHVVHVRAGGRMSGKTRQMVGEIMDKAWEQAARDAGVATDEENTEAVSIAGGGDAAAKE